MGKVKIVEKSRKEYRCSKCGELIPVGSRYYKGELNFSRPIVRCMKCGLKHYEVTTSDYVRTVGAIVEDWGENYPVEDGVWEGIAEALEELRDELQERFDNMPEQLQENSDTGCMLQERIDALDSAISELTDYSGMDDFLQEAYDEMDEESQEVIDKQKAARNDADFSEWYLDFWENPKTDAEREVAGDWRERTEEHITEFIETALEGLEY